MNSLCWNRKWFSLNMVFLPAIWRCEWTDVVRYCCIIFCQFLTAESSSLFVCPGCLAVYVTFFIVIVDYVLFFSHFKNFPSSHTAWMSRRLQCGERHELECQRISRKVEWVISSSDLLNAKIEMYRWGTLFLSASQGEYYLNFSRENKDVFSSF